MHQFTSKERDAETGLDNYEARYYSSPQGRFLSIDPGNASASSSDPQGWNGYAYGRNNPLKYTDPDGMMYRLCTPSGGCIDNYSDSDFYWNFQSDPSIYLSAGGSIFADGQYIGYFTHLSDDPWYVDLSNGLSNFLGNGSQEIQRKAEEDWSQRNYLGWTVDKVADFIWPSSTSDAVLAMAPIGKAFPRKIAGWIVSEHLFSRMAQDLGHRVPSGAIEQVIRYGQTLPAKGEGLIVKYLPGINEKGVTVLLKPSTGEIVMARIGKP
jgi:RHS repeat-associated protein